MWYEKNKTIYGHNAVNKTIVDKETTVSTSPCNGVYVDVCNNNQPTEFELTLKNNNGYSFINLVSNETGINHLFLNEKIYNYNFNNIRGLFVHKLITGKTVKIATVSNVGENESSGQIVLIDDKGDIRTIYEDSNCQQLISRVTRVGLNDIIMYHRITSDINNKRKCEVYVLISNDGFETVVNKKVFNTDYECQCYFVQVCSDGTLLLPYVKRMVLDSGDKCYLDIATCDINFDNVKQLNQFKTTTSRGLLEPKALKVDSDNYTIISRSENGCLMKSNYNSKTKTLSECEETIFKTSSVNFDVLTYNNKNLLSFTNVNPEFTSNDDKNYPRPYISICEVDSSLSSFDNYNLVLSNDNVDGDYTNLLPFIHSTLLSVIDECLYISVEKCTITNIDTYLLSCRFNDIFNKLTNVSNFEKTFKFNIPIGSYRVEVLGCVDSVNNFTILNKKINNIGLSIVLDNRIIKLPFYEVEKNYLTIFLQNNKWKLPLDSRINLINNGYKYKFNMCVDGKIITIATIT